MKISELAPGAICRVAGMELELELLTLNPAGAYVRSPRVVEREFTTGAGELVALRARPRAVLISSNTLVELVS